MKKEAQFERLKTGLRKKLEKFAKIGQELERMSKAEHRQLAKIRPEFTPERIADLRRLATRNLKTVEEIYCVLVADGLKKIWKSRNVERIREEIFEKQFDTLLTFFRSIEYIQKAEEIHLKKIAGKRVLRSEIASLKSLRVPP